MLVTNCVVGNISTHSSQYCAQVRTIDYQTCYSRPRKLRINRKMRCTRTMIEEVPSPERSLNNNSQDKGQPPNNINVNEDCFFFYLT